MNKLENIYFGLERDAPSAMNGVSLFYSLDSRKFYMYGLDGLKRETIYDELITTAEGVNLYNVPVGVEITHSAGEYVVVVTSQVDITLPVITEEYSQIIFNIKNLNNGELVVNASDTIDGEAYQILSHRDNMRLVVNNGKYIIL